MSIPNTVSSYGRDKGLNQQHTIEWSVVQVRFEVRGYVDTQELTRCIMSNKLYGMPRKRKFNIDLLTTLYPSDTILKLQH